MVLNMFSVRFVYDLLFQGTIEVSFHVANQCFYSDVAKTSCRKWVNSFWSIHFPGFHFRLKFAQHRRTFYIFSHS